MSLSLPDVSIFLRLLDPDQLQALLHLELRTREEEGFETAAFRRSCLHETTQSGLIAIYLDLIHQPPTGDLHPSEPESLPGILASCPPGPRHVPPGISLATLFDRIHGGWLGRVAGCVLGKPVEPWGPKSLIVEYLTRANSYPLSNYIPRLVPFSADFTLNLNAAGTFLGEISGAPDDDDTDYTLLGLHMLETYGLDLTASQVAAEWLAHLAYHKTWTAERTAYRNLILGVPPTQAASWINPEREYIGARIRADIYGLVLPGNPQLAAQLAWHDASLSHTKNGIYSAMFMAACVAWAFVTNNVSEIIQVGLSEIPQDCRLARAIHHVLSIHRICPDFDSAYEQLLPQQAAYHPVHAINNTVWLVLALLYGEGDFEKTICNAVVCGFDTDCNGANAGTILGVLTGAHALPRKWTDPLKDTLRTAVSQFAEMRISDLARRTFTLSNQFSSQTLP